jgi:hypothetical protein
MNREDTIKMARESGFAEGDLAVFPDLIVHFADLVAAHEREACAKVCDERQEVFRKYYTKGLPALCAEAIRARGQA